MLAVQIRLLSGSYGAGSRPDQGEWPPHPARLMCAWVAVAREQGDWDVLRGLEQAGPPQVWAPPIEMVSVVLGRGWVVTNQRIPQARTQGWPARTNGRRSRSECVPPMDRFAIVWPDLATDQHLLDQLAALARRVPYLGRSSCRVAITVTSGLGQEPEWVVYRPTTLDRPAAAELRVPYPGYVTALQQAHADGRRAHEVARAIPYTTEDPHTAPTAASNSADRVHHGPYCDLVMFRFDGPIVAPSGHRLLDYTVMLRAALIDRIGHDVPAQVHGHGADHDRHVAYLAVPDIGHRHADGHLLGVALAIPATLTGADRARLGEHLTLPGRALSTLTVRGRRIRVSRPSPGYGPRGLSTDRWTGGPTGAHQWVSATPMMLDRHPRRTVTTEDIITASLQREGYPTPQRIEVLPTPPLTGGPHDVDLTALPAHRRRRPLVHTRITFAQPVIGPVLAGTLRYLGVGLFAPMKAETAS